MCIYKCGYINIFKSTYDLCRCMHILSVSSWCPFFPSLTLVSLTCLLQVSTCAVKYRTVHTIFPKLVKVPCCVSVFGVSEVDLFSVELLLLFGYLMASETAIGFAMLVFRAHLWTFFAVPRLPDSIYISACTETGALCCIW